MIFLFTTSSTFARLDNAARCSGLTAVFLSKTVSRCRLPGYQLLDFVNTSLREPFSTPGKWQPWAWH